MIPKSAAYFDYPFPNNIAVYAQCIPVLGMVEDETVDCFRKGGDSPYKSSKRFHDVMAEESGQTVLPVLLEGILPLAEGVVDALRRGISMVRK